MDGWDFGRYGNEAPFPSLLEPVCGCALSLLGLRRVARGQLAACLALGSCRAKFKLPCDRRGLRNRVNPLDRFFLGAAKTAIGDSRFWPNRTATGSKFDRAPQTIRLPEGKSEFMILRSQFLMPRNRPWGFCSAALLRDDSSGCSTR